MVFSVIRKHWKLLGNGKIMVVHRGASRGIKTHVLKGKLETQENACNTVREIQIIWQDTCVYFL